MSATPQKPFKELEKQVWKLRTYETIYNENIAINGKAKILYFYLHPHFTASKQDDPIEFCLILLSSMEDLFKEVLLG